MGEGARVTVLGVGNLLLQDDGVGVHVINRLREEDLPESVELVDGGTYGPDLAPFIEDAERLIVIDAVKGGCEPGAIYRVTPEIMKETRDQPMSIHQIGFLESLDMIYSMKGRKPLTIIFGVEPQVIDWGLELTEPVKDSFERLLELVKQEIQAMLDQAGETA
ncbi:MAG: HyaD/HybD family hydrogenase maturation endopeptidase [Firmicutes bacterium]|nr:HyaD/HybD family hydrogenase maturation endopeptidase [Bacillota bacterium]